MSALRVDQAPPPAGASHVTHLLAAAAGGDRRAADALLPLVYDELRRPAGARLAGERPGQTLDATGLVHEAYLRLVGGQRFAHQGHFFAAAAEAMRRILVDCARKKARLKRGGGRARVGLDRLAAGDMAADPDLVVGLDEALGRLEADHPQAAGLVKLRFFVGLSARDAAAALGVSKRTADRDWAFAKAWLFRELDGSK